VDDNSDPLGMVVRNIRSTTSSRVLRRHFRFTVVVRSGLYDEWGDFRLDFGGRDIVLTSEAGRRIIIDCWGYFYGFYFRHGETSDAHFRFTIRIRRGFLHVCPARRRHLLLPVESDDRELHLHRELRHHVRRRDLVR
jgi:hypothetical protein